MTDYVFVCIRDLTCRPEDDTHSIACHRENDRERAGHYVDLVAESLPASPYHPSRRGEVYDLDEPIPYSIADEAWRGEAVVTRLHHPSCPQRQGKSGDCVCADR